MLIKSKVKQMCLKKPAELLIMYVVKMKSVCENFQVCVKWCHAGSVTAVGESKCHHLWPIVVYIWWNGQNASWHYWSHKAVPWALFWDRWHWFPQVNIPVFEVSTTFLFVMLYMLICCRQWKAIYCFFHHGIFSDIYKNAIMAKYLSWS